MAERNRKSLSFSSLNRRGIVARFDGRRLTLPWRQPHLALSVGLGKPAELEFRGVEGCDIR